MKNMKDINCRFKAELDQWYIKQTKNIYDRYYLWYLPSNFGHDGGLFISREHPANSEYKLATSEAIRGDLTIEQNMNHFNKILQRLPILTITQN